MVAQLSRTAAEQLRKQSQRLDEGGLEGVVDDARRCYRSMDENSGFVSWGLGLLRRAYLAAGMPAVLQTLKFAFKEGPIRNARMLTILNQKGGFDCPSCAWPDPDGHRSFAEFCENGAKAIAWEATSKRVTPKSSPSERS